MDPLSISASIAALLQVAGTVISYLSDVSDGPKDLQRIRLEVCSILSILIMLQDQSNQAKNDVSFSSTFMSLNVPNGPFEQFRTALELLSLKLTPMQGWKKLGRAVKWPFEREEIGDILRIIERLKTVFSLARQNDHIALSRAIQNDMKDVHRTTDKISEVVTNIQVDERHKQVHQWLSAPDPSSNYNEALKSRYANTSTWFLNTNAYLDWLSKSSSLLWLYGIPGCGKTVISSTIIQRTVSECQSRPNTVVLYFYFDFKDIEKQQHEKMMRSLIVQLSSECVKVPQILASSYASCMNGERQPVYDSLLLILHQMMRLFAETYLVLDALDECLERQELLGAINELNGWKDVNLHILTTSRWERDIEESLEPLCDEHDKICIQSIHINDDIRAYIHGRLQTDRDLKRWRNKPEVQLEIEDTLMFEADGMFRWAACQLDALRICINLTGLRKILVNLPKTLDETYQRILTGVPDEYAEDALRILRWLCTCKRPLRLGEVADLIAVDCKLQRYDCERRPFDPRDVVKLCPSLVKVSPEERKHLEILFPQFKAFGGNGEATWHSSSSSSSSDILELSHKSVKDYLLMKIIQVGTSASVQLSVESSHAALAETAMAYLLQFDNGHFFKGNEFLGSQLLEERPASMYAANFWSEHLNAAKDRRLESLALKIFSDEWVFRHIIHLASHGRPGFYCSIFQSPPSKLDYASNLGLLGVCQSLLDTGDRVFGGALGVASRKGHEDVVRLLLKYGANPNAVMLYQTSPLNEAIYGSHERIALILITAGANIDPDDALISAAQKGLFSTVESLLTLHADVNKQRLRGMEEVDDDPSGTVGRSALHEAAWGGHGDVVSLLLQHGADINATYNCGDTALHDAVRNDRYDIVKILVDAGAKTDILVLGKSPLSLAESRCSHEIAQLLRNSQMSFGNSVDI